MTVAEAENMCQPAAEGRYPAWLLALILLLIWIAYLATPGFRTTDTLATVPLAISLLEDGDFDLGEVADDPSQPLLDTVGDRSYTRYPWAPAVMAVPFVAGLRWALRGESLGPWLFECVVGPPVRNAAGQVDSRASLISHRINVERLAASTYAVLALAILFGVLRRRHVPCMAAVIVLAFAFGSISWTTNSRVMWQHGPSVLFSTAALWALVGGPVRRGRAAAAGAFVAMAYTMRPTNAVVVLVMTSYVALRHRRQLLTYLAAAAAVAIVFCGINLATYGSILQPYFAAGKFLEAEASSEAAFGLLVSPARGLFVYSPFLLLAPVALVWQLIARRLAVLDIACWAVIVLQWVVVLRWGNWFGGHSWGPRLLADLQPFLALVLLPPQVSAARASVRRVVWWVLGALAVVAVAINARYVDPATRAWDRDPVLAEQCPSRLWDWHDVPFLRGTPFDGRREPLSRAGDELGFRVVDLTGGFDAAIPFPLPPGHHEVVIRLSRCAGMQAGFRWSVEGIGPSGLSILHEEVVPSLLDGEVLDLVAPCELGSPTRLIVRAHAEGNATARFRVTMTIRRRK